VKVSGMRTIVDECVQSLLAVNVSAVISFMPQLLSQLFHLLTRTSSEDVAMNAVRQVLNVQTQYSTVAFVEHSD